MKQLKIIFMYATTLLSRFLLLCVVFILFIPVSIFLLLPESWRYDSWFFNWLKYFFYAALVKGTFLPITVIGKENIPHEPAIIVANHQSSLDIPLLGMLIKGAPHVWLATTDLLTSPIWKFVLPKVAVLIDMTTPAKGMRSLVKAVNMVYEKKRHALIFPEGSRFTDEKLHDFYAGFVILAKKTGRPVVPVRIFNVHKVYPKGQFLLYRYPIKVIVGKPMILQEDESDTEFKDRIFQWFLEQSGD